MVLQHHSHIPVDKLPEWMNAVGLLLSNLPEAHWQGLHAKLERMLASPALTQWPHTHLTPTQLFDFNEVHSLKTDTALAYLMATVHATWHHAGFNQLCGILDLGTCPPPLSLSPLLVLLVLSLVMIDSYL